MTVTETIQMALTALNASPTSTLSRQSVQAVRDQFTWLSDTYSRQLATGVRMDTRAQWLWQVDSVFDRVKAGADDASGLLRASWNASTQASLYDGPNIDVALVACLALAPDLEARVTALWAKPTQARRVKPQWKAALLALTLVGGLGALYVMEESRQIGVTRDIDQHVTIAMTAYGLSSGQIASALGALDTLSARASSFGDATRRTEITAQLEAANRLNIDAIDALDRAQQLRHDLGDAAAATLTANVGAATGTKDLIGAVRQNFRNTPVPSAVDTTRATRTRWNTSASVYATALKDQASLLMPNVTGTSALALTKPQNALSSLFEGRGSTIFLVRVGFAVAFALIGGAVLKLLLGILGMGDPTDAVRKMIDDLIGAAPSAVPSAWPLLASVGVAAAAVTAGYALSNPAPPPEPKATASVAPISSAVQSVIDSLRRELVTIKQHAESIDIRAH
jgi:hypothetical protein